jgi:hypothetical protein
MGLSPADRRALERVIARVERHLAIQADTALYWAETAADFDRAVRGDGGARVAGMNAHRAAELAHELFVLKGLLER